ncbi:MAG: glycosyltransferase involved in cell wall biosynthesis [Halioglobus sp.]|jgi:glycosyltransferase involved in cell wall biosynthesis
MQTVTISSNTSWYLYNFRASTIRRLVADSYRVVCISPEDIYSQKLVNDLGCEWLPLRMSNHGNNPFKDAGLVLQFWRYYRLLRPVVALHFTIKNNVYGTWAARLLAVPAINNISGLGTAFIRKGIVAAIVRLLYRTSQPFAHRVFCQNNEDLKHLADGQLVPPDRLELLPGSGVDLERFNPELRKPHDGNFRFLFAGRMLSDKGLVELVAAVRKVNAEVMLCDLWLSGFADTQNVSAISSEKLAEWGDEPGIEWLGPTDSIEQLFAEVDCVVLPSYREGMPRSLLEAGAMGLPVIATDVPGCRSIVSDGFNGVLCEAKNSDSLAQAMLRILKTPARELQKMGENGRELVTREYSEDLVVDATVRAIAKAVQN